MPRLTAIVVGALLVVAGVWALADSRSFYENAATFPPYHRHFIHDLGAFLVGCGAMLLIALRYRSALTAALLANAIAAVLHAYSHFVDRDLGGRSSDPIVFAVIAFVLIVAAAQSLKGRRS